MVNYSLSSEDIGWIIDVERLLGRHNVYIRPPRNDLLGRSRSPFRMADKWESDHCQRMAHAQHQLRRRNERHVKYHLYPDVLPFHPVELMAVVK